MSHETHDKHNHCEHNVKYCTTCDVPYCTKCGREWKGYVWTSPYISPTYPYYTPWWEIQPTTYTSPNTGGSVTSGNISVGHFGHNH